MSAASDNDLGPSSVHAVQAEPGDPLATDEALGTLLQRYARLGLTVAPAIACVVRVRRGGERWQVARAGQSDTERDDAFCDRARREGALLREGDRLGVPIASVGGLMVRLKPDAPSPLPARNRAALEDLVALLCREVGGGTERAAAAEAARAAAVEVEHQMRNGFAKINAMIDLAAREQLSDDKLVSTLKRRLSTLGEANEVAIAHGFGPAPLDTLARAAFRAVLGRLCDARTVQIDGEPLLVSPAVASVLAPIFGELAADALARDCLGQAAPVRFTWRRQPERGRAVFTWRESTASEATPFGSAFLRLGGPGTLRGEAVIDQGASEGASYTLAIPERFVAPCGG